MNLQFLEQTANHNFGKEQVFCLNDDDGEKQVQQDDDEQSEVFALMDIAWLDCAENLALETVSDDEVQLSNRRQNTFLTKKRQIGWTPDFTNHEATQTTSGR